MKPTTAYKLLNKLIWRGNLPDAKVELLHETFIPKCYGITLFDDDFARPIIYLNAADKRWGKTLVHECLHVGEPLLPHGKEFDKLVNRYWRYAKKHIKGFKGL